MAKWLLVVFVFLLIAGCGGEEPVEESIEEPVEESVEEEVCEVEEYDNEINWNISVIGEDFTWLGNHFAEYDGSEQWYDWAEDGMLDILYWIEQAEDIDPPPERQAHYDTYMEAMENYRTSINLLMEALETDDDSLIDEAMEYMDAGTEIIEGF